MCTKPGADLFHRQPETKALYFTAIKPSFRGAIRSWSPYPPLYSFITPLYCPHSPLFHSGHFLIYPFISRESLLVHNLKFLPVAIEDIDPWTIIRESSQRSRWFLTSEVLARLKSEVRGETGEMEYPSSCEKEVLLFSEENSVSMRPLGVEFI